MRQLFLAILLLALFPIIAFSASATTNGNNPTYKASIESELTTHFIYHGLSMSDKNPALNASFLFNLGPQFKFGFWGSNISHISNADDNFWFKILAEVKVDFASNSIFKLNISDDHYYKANDRNGQLITLSYMFRSYLADFQWSNNFEGSHSDSYYLNVGYLFDFWRMTKLGVIVGYTMQHTSSYSDYFDAKGFIQYTVNNNFNTEFGGTITSNNTQFSGRADPFLYGSLSLNY